MYFLQRNKNPRKNAAIYFFWNTLHFTKSNFGLESNYFCISLWHCFHSETHLTKIVSFPIYLVAESLWFFIKWNTFRGNAIIIINTLEELSQPKSPWNFITYSWKKTYDDKNMVDEQGWWSKPEWLELVHESLPEQKTLAPNPLQAIQDLITVNLRGGVFIGIFNLFGYEFGLAMRLRNNHR